MKLDSLDKVIHERLELLDRNLNDNITNTNTNTESIVKLRHDHDYLYRSYTAHIKSTIGKSTKSGIAKIKHAFKLRTVGKRNLFFKRWVQITISLREKVILKAMKFNKLLTIVYNKVDQPYSLKIMFKIWRDAKNRMKSYEKRKRLVHYIAKKWMTKTNILYV